VDLSVGQNGLDKPGVGLRGASDQFTDLPSINQLTIERFSIL
jgi:hypothetical protein